MPAVFASWYETEFNGKLIKARTSEFKHLLVNSVWNLREIVFCDCLHHTLLSTGLHLRSEHIPWRVGNTVNSLTISYITHQLNFISLFHAWCQFPRQPKYLCFSTHAHKPLVYVLWDFLETELVFVLLFFGLFFFIMQRVASSLLNFCDIKCLIFVNL